MRSKRRSTLIFIISLPIFLGLLQSCDSSLKHEEPKNTDSMEESKEWDTLLQEPKLAIKGLPYYIRIRDPDGKRFVWPVSQDGIKEIKPILASYPSETIDGLKFYIVVSWKEMSQLTKAVSEGRDKMIWELFDEISILKSRVSKLERKLSELSKSKRTDHNPEPQ